jgi:hypothetical protein
MGENRLRASKKIMKQLRDRESCRQMRHRRLSVPFSVNKLSKQFHTHNTKGGTGPKNGLYHRRSRGDSGVRLLEPR